MNQLDLKKVADQDDDELCEKMLEDNDEHEDVEEQVDMFSPLQNNVSLQAARFDPSNELSTLSMRYSTRHIGGHVVHLDVREAGSMSTSCVQLSRQDLGGRAETGCGIYRQCAKRAHGAQRHAAREHSALDMSSYAPR